MAFVTMHISFATPLFSLFSPCLCSHRIRHHHRHPYDSKLQQSHRHSTYSTLFAIVQSVMQSFRTVIFSSLARVAPSCLLAARLSAWTSHFVHTHASRFQLSRSPDASLLATHTKCSRAHPYLHIWWSLARSRLSLQARHSPPALSSTRQPSSPAAVVLKSTHQVKHEHKQQRASIGACAMQPSGVPSADAAAPLSCM